MSNTKLNKVIASAALTGFIFCSFYGSAFAVGTASKAAPNNKTNVPKNSSGQNFQGQNRQNQMKVQLDTLVKSKKITQSQETKVLAYLDKKNAERRAEMQKVRNMTDAQRQAYFAKQSNQRQNQNQLSALVKNNTITQSQADAINKAIYSNRGFGNRPNFGNNNQPGKQTKPTTTKKK